MTDKPEIVKVKNSRYGSTTFVIKYDNESFMCNCWIEEGKKYWRKFSPGGEYPSFDHIHKSNVPDIVKQKVDKERLKQLI
ncbi:MAG: hypothetical protein ACOC56_06140 [Atribacterota bacterium]